MPSGTRALALALLHAAAAALAACSSAGEREPRLATVVETASVSVDFESAAPGAHPAGFTSALTGDGPRGEWAVETHPWDGRNVLAQRSLDPTPLRFPLCLLDGYTALDFSLSVRFRAVSGSVDRAAGLVARLRGPDDYLLVRANALEGNVRLYTVVAGERHPLAGADVAVSTGEWHELRLDARGSSFAVFLDGALLFTATDVTFDQPGQIGLWTKADSVTRFDDLRCGPLRADSPLGGGAPL